MVVDTLQSMPRPARHRNAGNVVKAVHFHTAETMAASQPAADDQPQPRLSTLYPGAADVAVRCLGLEEQRDGRRPGSGAACAPAGGWDGDFRENASPWDVGDAARNRGAG